MSVLSECAGKRIKIYYKGARNTTHEGTIVSADEYFVHLTKITFKLAEDGNLIDLPNNRIIPLSDQNIDYIEVLSSEE